MAVNRRVHGTLTASRPIERQEKNDRRPDGGLAEKATCSRLRVLLGSHHAGQKQGTNDPNLAQVEKEDEMEAAYHFLKHN
jgi:hypothetical protein